MILKMFRFLLKIIVFVSLISQFAFAEIIRDVKVSGNKRISKETT